MRISDWSSDVCSSDLPACRTVQSRWPVPARYPASLGRMLRHHSADIRRELALGIRIGGPDEYYSAVSGYLAGKGVGSNANEISTKIGRASCRERVCQYG